MPSIQSAAIILILASQCFFVVNVAFAHPASGIGVDVQSHVYFIYSGRGVMRIEPSGKLTNIHEDKGGYWLALDADGVFADVTPRQIERITPDGTIPSLIFASGGAPLIVSSDRALYYGSNGLPEDSFPPGALTVVRLSAGGRQDLFAPSLKQELGELHDGITGLASGTNGSIYLRNLEWDSETEARWVHCGNLRSRRREGLRHRSCRSQPGQCFLPAFPRSRRRFSRQCIRCGHKLPSSSEDHS
jgi:hypothetical protein